MVRVFNTPVSIGGQSKNIDKTLDTLAADFKMTDMRNDMGSVMNSMRAGQSDFTPKWGSLPEVKIGESGNAVAASIGGARMSENVYRPEGGGMVVGFEGQQTAYGLSAPKAVPLSPRHVDNTDIRTVKPAR